MLDVSVCADLVMRIRIIRNSSPKRRFRRRVRRGAREYQMKLEIDGEMEVSELSDVGQLSSLAKFVAIANNYSSVLVQRLDPDLRCLNDVTSPCSELTRCSVVEDCRVECCVE